MKLRFLLFCCTVLCSTFLVGQPTQSARLFIPFMDRESQSNVVVSVSDLGSGQPCPDELTNSLLNTHLFTVNEQQAITHAFSKYKYVSPSEGPSGTILTSSYTTNHQFKAYDRIVNSEETISTFQYTNREAREVISFGVGLLAEYRNGSNDGYYVSFNRTGSGTQFGFGEIREGKPNGLFVRFEDMHSQGTVWDYKNAEFNGSRLSEYRQYTNGYVLGKLFMWNVNNGNLLIKAIYTSPYDWNRHVLHPKW